MLCLDAPITCRADIPKSRAADIDDDVCMACVMLVRTARLLLRPILSLIIAAAYYRNTTLSPIIRYCRNPSDDALRSRPESIRAKITRYRFKGHLLSYQIDQFDAARIVVPLDDDLRGHKLHKYHDSATGRHLGREKIYLALSRYFYWPHMYKWVRKSVRSCKVCQCVKTAPSSQASFRPLPIATEV